MSESKLRSDSCIFVRKTRKLLFLPVLLMLVGIGFFNPGIVIAGEDDQATGKL